MDSLTKAQNEEIFLSELDSSIILKIIVFTVFGFHSLFDMHSQSRSLNLCVPLVPHL